MRYSKSMRGFKGIISRLMRKLRGGMRCYQEHGGRYTWFLLLEKMASALWAPLSIAVFFFVRIFPAYRRYAALKRRTGGAHIYCQYYPGTGDVRYSAAYLKVMYGPRFGAERPDKAVFVVSGCSAGKAAALFCPREISIVPWKDRAALSLVHLLRFAGTGILDMTILHYFDSMMYTSLFFPVMSRKSTSFEDLYALALMGREGFEWPEPAWVDDEEWVHRLFVEKGLKPHKTVLLSPFANSLAYGPDRDFSEMVVERLKDNDFSVCTNVSGKRERPIRGSVGVNIPYKYLNVFCRHAGYLVAFRSGMCDLIMTVPCRKVILYPDKLWPDAETGVIPVIDFFSLRQTEDNDTVEYTYAGDSVQKALLSRIVQSLIGDRVYGLDV